MSESPKQKWVRHEHGNHYVLEGDNPTPIGMFLKAEHAAQAVRAVNTYDEREALIRELLAELKECRTRLYFAGLSTVQLDRRIEDAEKMMGGGE